MFIRRVSAVVRTMRHLRKRLIKLSRTRFAKATRRQHRRDVNTRA
jgi:hypothetical protein